MDTTTKTSAATKTKTPRRAAPTVAKATKTGTGKTSAGHRVTMAEEFLSRGYFPTVAPFTVDGTTSTRFIIDGQDVEVQERARSAEIIRWNRGLRDVLGRWDGSARSRVTVAADAITTAQRIGRRTGPRLGANARRSVIW